MLIARKIDFKHHDLLTVQMLEGMRDSTLDGILVPFMTYANGIINGLEVFMNENKLISISPGAVKWDSQLFVMTEWNEDFVLADDWRSGFIVLRRNDQYFTIELVQQLMERDIEIVRFQNREPKAVLHQEPEFQQLHYINRFDFRYVKVAGSDGRLTFSAPFSASFGRALLNCQGATIHDIAFAWEAVKSPPTRTMWEIYLRQNNLDWSEDMELIYAQLQSLLREKKKAVPSSASFQSEGQVNVKEDKKTNVTMVR